LGVMFAFPLVRHRLVRIIILILYTVIYGPLQLSVCRVLNIILSFLMITRTICGLFLYALSDTYTTLTHFFAHVQTQFGVTVKAVQCDNGKEFDNSSARAFFLTHGVHLRLSCPYTSAQNGKAERIIRSTNNVVRSLLFQASAPPSFWVETLSTSTHLLNLLPTKTLTPQLHTRSSLAPRRHTTTCVFSDVRAIPTSPQPPLTS